EKKEKPELLLGHVSILCAIAFTFHENQQRPLILSCDRDEKLRVSKYPNTYNIQAFGLGHTEFVTTVAAAPLAHDLVATGSGDGTVRLWDTRTGELVQTVELRLYLAKYYESGAAKRGANSYEDRTAANDRYGVLRVRATDTAFVAVVERIPAVVVLPLLKDGNGLGEPQIVDVAMPPTDVAVLRDHLLVSYAPSEDGALVAALKLGEEGVYVADEILTNALSENIVTKDVDIVPQVKSIFVWGNKMFLERPRNDEE
ncbi:tRNA (guanine-N(7)-)-methyltransferase non-catalytic subunit trm82, partial [Coemansia aciculifera]